MSQHSSHPPPLSALTRIYKDVHNVERGGYLWEYCPEHPKSNPWGFVPQHRLVVERLLGRFLKSSEYVHHIDENPMNNEPDNLVVLSRSEHMAVHQESRRLKKYPPITREIVQKELSKGGLKSAARALGCNPETIRNNFPDLVAPYKRKSPSILDDPKWVARLRELAADPNIGYREAAEELGMACESVAHILHRNNIEWVRKTKAGELHRKYVRKGHDYADDPELVERVRECAADIHCTYANAAQLLGYSQSAIRRIVQRNNIEWNWDYHRYYPVEK